MLLYMGMINVPLHRNPHKKTPAQPKVVRTYRTYIVGEPVSRVLYACA